MTNNNPSIPDVLSMSDMARLVNLSRSRFYQLISEGIFHPPIYNIKSKRPFYSREIAEKNLQLKRNNVGANGKIVLFYCSRSSSPYTKISRGSRKVESNRPVAQSNHQELKEGLAALGLRDVSDVQIDSALRECFPDGTENTDSAEILRQVFLSIKRQNTTDNVNR